MTRAARHNAGFTLYELLLSMALMGLITTWAGMSFFYTTDIWGKIKRDSELNEQANLAFADIGHSVARVITPRLSGIPLKSIPDAAKDANSPVADSIVLPIQIVNEGPMQNRVMGVIMAYHLDRNKSAMMKTKGNLTDTDPVGYPELVAKNVRSLRFEYLGQSDADSWSPNWSGAKLPAAVRVSLVLADPGHPEQAISRKAVFAIHVQ